MDPISNGHAPKPAHDFAKTLANLGYPTHFYVGMYDPISAARAMDALALKGCEIVAASAALIPAPPQSGLAIASKGPTLVTAIHLFARAWKTAVEIEGVLAFVTAHLNGGVT